MGQPIWARNVVRPPGLFPPGASGDRGPLAAHGRRFGGLRGCVALVAGATRELGGVRLLPWPNAAQRSSVVSDRGGVGMATVADLTRSLDVRVLCERVERDFGELDVRATQRSLPRTLHQGVHLSTSGAGCTHRYGLQRKASCWFPIRSVSVMGMLA